jgi:hypothetical protein
VASAVRLGLFDLQGRLIRELEHQPRMDAGRYAVQWDGRSDDGTHVAAGIYFLTLEAGGSHHVQRVVVMQ